MTSISIFNDVLGPVMRGPSSSHTAGSYHIARLVRDLFGSRLSRARFTFDPRGSYGQVFREQGVDRAFAAGLLGWPLTDARFFRALDEAPGEGLDLEFDVHDLRGADHPNTVAIELSGNGTRLEATARSIGGGAVEVVAVDGCEVRLTGRTYEVLVAVKPTSHAEALTLLSHDGQMVGEVVVTGGTGPQPCELLHARRYAPLRDDERRTLERLSCDGRVREARPIAFIARGPASAASAADLIALATARNVSLGRVALANEAALLGMSEAEGLEEMLRRLDVMRGAVEEGLSADAAPDRRMQLLEPTAHRVFEAEASGRVALGGPHTRAAARALAAMHVNSRMGVVCAAPTGGSAGVLPGVMVTLMETENGRGTSSAVRDRAALALFAAGAIGAVVAARATFAAEVAGCQVEIGAAGAMAAAAVVEWAGGSAAQAADAAAIAFQNTMGSVCDLVQGVVEIPCHTRNAVAASSAFVCADLVLGGYHNPIPLDETIDAVYAVGKMLPSELRCTARGGLALAPSALAIRRAGK